MTQGALSVVLLVGSGLFVRSLNNVLAIPLGYDARRVLEIYPDFRGALDSAAESSIRRRLLGEAERIPGVVAAARVNGRLFGTSTATLRVPGIDSVERLGRFNFQVTSPGYFTVMQTRILKGRGFDATDQPGAYAAVITDEFERVHFDADGLGKRFILNGDEHTVQGTVKGFIPLRNRRAGKFTHIGEGMTEYTLDGTRVGYGLSEYLDQVE